MEQVIQAVIITGTTALVAGSLGGLIALWRDRTFQSLALTVLIIVMYLAAVVGLQGVPRLAALAGWQVSEEQIRVVQQHMEPFHALLSVHASLLYAQEGFAPAYGFGLFMLATATMLNLFGMYKLRVWNPSGEPIMQRERPEDAVDRERELTEAEVVSQTNRASVHAAPGEARPVVGNPILWREVATRAYGRRPLLVKLAYLIVLVAICWLALSPVINESKRGGMLAVVGLLPVSVLSLLLVTAQATTAITSERDTGALDLLLVTDLSPREFIFGKVLGIIWNTKEYLLPPLLLAGVYGYYQCLAIPPKNHGELAGAMNATALLCVVITCLVLLSFAMMLGIHVALRTTNSQVAIIHSLSTIFFLTVGTLVCIALILINRRFEYQWGSFVFFLIAGIGGLWYVLSGDRPTAALSWAAWFCPLGVLYSIMTILVGKPGSQESADPWIPTLVIGASFGFTIAAMLVPLLSEFDVAMGRTSGGAD
jgi:hypothetical protein